MQVVIDIDENLYTRLFDNGVDDCDNAVEMAKAIRRGILLPKCHGLLKDIDWIDDNCPYYYSDEDARLCYSVNDVNEAPTIIEADIIETDKEKEDNDIYR